MTNPSGEFLLQVATTINECRVSTDAVTSRVYGEQTQRTLSLDIYTLRTKTRINKARKSMLTGATRHVPAKADSVALPVITHDSIKIRRNAREGIM